MMLYSFAILMITALICGEIAGKLHLPRLLGMLLAGILLGNLDVLDHSFLALSADLRQIALIIILTRAGLNLDLAALKRAGLPALLLCFIPASLEIIGVTFGCVLLLNTTWLEGALIGAILAAVSPAVIVPKMLKLQEEGYGNSKGIPQMIMAAASVDDIFVIVFFQAFLALSIKGEISYLSFVNIPVSIVLGIGVGIVCGLVFAYLSKKIKGKETEKMLLLLCTSFLLVTLEKQMGTITFSAMIAIMSMGATYAMQHPACAKVVSSKYSSAWSWAEIWLFALVGACVEIDSLLSGSIILIVVLLIGLLFRSIGTFGCISFGKLNKKEKAFCVLAYLPKATVQAAIGSLPLTSNLPIGQKALSIAVLAILITAPLGALLLDMTYKKWLTYDIV